MGKLGAGEEFPALPAFQPRQAHPMLHKLALLASFTLPHSALGMGRDFHTFSEASDNGAAPEKAVELYDYFYDPDEDDEVLGLGPVSQLATSELRETARQIREEHSSQGWDLRLLEWMIAQGLEGRSGGGFDD